MTICRSERVLGLTGRPLGTNTDPFKSSALTGSNGSKAAGSHRWPPCGFERAAPPCVQSNGRLVRPFALADVAGSVNVGSPSSPTTKDRSPATNGILHDRCHKGALASTLSYCGGNEFRHLSIRLARLVPGVRGLATSLASPSPAGQTPASRRPPMCQRSSRALSSVPAGTWRGWPGSCPHTN